MKKLILLSTLSMLVLAFAGCQNSNNNKNPNNAVNNNQSITDQVKSYINSIYNISLDARNIKVTNDNGVVTLKGSVATQNEKTMIINFVQQLPGVNKVNDQLEVRGY